MEHALIIYTVKHIDFILPRNITGLNFFYLFQVPVLKIMYAYTKAWDTIRPNQKIEYATCTMYDTKTGTTDIYKINIIYTCKCLYNLYRGNSNKISHFQGTYFMMRILLVTLFTVISDVNCRNLNLFPWTTTW